MAIEFLRSIVISRKNSIRRIPAHLAYRACSKVYDESQKRHFDYTNKRSVIDSFLVNANGNSLEQLGNKMEATEKRQDARVAREFILALPYELGIEDNKEICRKFANLLVDRYGIAAHVAIHKPDEVRDYEKYRSEDSLKNIHAHITVSERRMGADGCFEGDKVREINKKEALIQLKEDTASIIDEFLKKRGFDPTQAKEKQQISTKHLGPILTRLERRGVNTDRGEHNRAILEVNKLKLQREKLRNEVKFLRKGVTLKGKIICSPENLNYKNDDPVVVLSKKSIEELFNDIEKGKLRPKKWHAPGILESISYKGLKIQTSELLLAGRGFSYKKLQEVERVMDRSGISSFPTFRHAIENRFPMGQAKKVAVVLGLILNGAENPQKIDNRDLSKKKAIKIIAPRSDEKNVFWHAKQAAYEIEKASKLNEYL